MAESRSFHHGFESTLDVDTTSTRPPEERAVLVGAPPASMSEHEVEEHLDELARLTDTAGARVVGSIIQRIDAPRPATYIGSGKVEELRDALRERDATLVVFDEDLTPAQGSNLEKALGVRTMDRTELILDIFALRARTAEAKLQVELAQLRYLRPRLRRMWTHLSRTGGGIGARGPGEQQLETDRRLIDRRISRLTRELTGISRARDTQRKGRKDAFTVALVGYTNAGKSSLLRALSGSELFVEDRLFATLDSATRAVDLGPGPDVLLTDTVGFIRKLPHHLVASFRATLEEVADADLLLRVVDISSTGWLEQMRAVEEVLSEAGAEGKQTLIALNKVDRLTHQEQAALEMRLRNVLPPFVFTTVRERGGLEALEDALRDRVRDRLALVRMRVPAKDGRTLAEAYREGEVLERELSGAWITLIVRAHPAIVGRWRAVDGVEVEQLDAA